MDKKCNICGVAFKATNRKLGCSELCIKAAHKIKKNNWKKSNKEKELNNLKRSYCNNKNSRIEYSLKWQKENKDKANAIFAKRRARKIKAQIGSFEDEIREVFKKAHLLTDKDGQKRHVHHIVPLQQYEDTVCGLHVPWNLEILTEDEHKKAHEELRKIYGATAARS